MKNILNRLSNLIKFNRKTNTTQVKVLPITQVSYNQKTQDSLVCYPYGVFSNAPIDNLNIALNVGASEENSITLELAIKELPTLQSGEVAIGNFPQKTFILFKSDNSIEIKRNDVVVMSILENQVIVTSQDTIINGNVTVNGTINATGDVSAGSVSLNSHVHGGVTVGGGISGPPQ